MATILSSGGADTFDALVYGQPHPGTLNFIQEQVFGATHNLTAAGQSFMQQTYSLYDQYLGEPAIRAARAAKRMLGTIWGSNDIRTIQTLDHFQSAPPIMQRYIMAEPTVRQMYLDNRIEGYEGTYQDPCPSDTVGVDQYDYRRVLNGVVEFTPEGNWQSNTYMDFELEDDQPLAFDQQLDIIDSWSNIVKLIRKGGEDPTSRWGADLP